MEKIERLDDVKRFLVDQEIMIIMKDGNPVFFVRRKDKILVKGPSSTYRISLDEVEEKENFKNQSDVKECIYTGIYHSGGTDCKNTKILFL